MKRSCILLLWFVSSAAFALDRNQLPVSPTVPTMEDCRQLVLALQQEQARRTADQTTCMRQEPRFVTLPSAGRCRESGLIAWGQCVEITDGLCELGDHIDRETTTCFERARQVAAQQREDEQTVALNASAVGTIMAKARLLATGASAVGKLLQDPKAFLYKALGRSNPGLLARAFPSLARDAAADDKDLAAQLYRYAYQHASGNAGLTPDPVVAAIQKDSLAKIDALYGDLFRQLDASLRQMRAFETSVAGLHLATPAPRSVARPARIDADDCSILDDFAATSRLRDDDPDRFLALTRRCTRR